MLEMNLKLLADEMEKLEELNKEMKYNDPYKWLLRYEELEEIDETIENMECEVTRLENALKHPGSFVGSKKDYEVFTKRVNKRIEYLTECIEILQDTHNEIVEGEDSE